MELNEENIKSFIEYKIVPYNSNITTVGLLFFLVFGLVVGLSNPVPFLASLTILVSFICYIIAMILYDSKRTIRYQNLFISAMLFCFSIIMLFASYKFFMGYSAQVKICVLLIIATLYIINSIVLCAFTLKKIHNGFFSKEQKKQTLNNRFIVGVITAVIILFLFFKFFLISDNTDISLTIIAMGCLCLSLYMCTCYSRLLRVILQLKYKIADESLEEYFHRNQNKSK